MGTTVISASIRCGPQKLVLPLSYRRLIMNSPPTGKTGKALLFEYTEELRDVLSTAKNLPPQLPGHYLIRNRGGKQYTTSGFKANWQRLMSKAVKQGIKHYTFNDIRAKSASDSASLQEASQRLGHTSTAITDRVYMRVPYRVKPLK